MTTTPSIESWATALLRVETTDREGVLLARLLIVIDDGEAEVVGPVVADRSRVSAMVEVFLDRVFAGR